jgi:two-component system, NarL family, sensor histidine kinase UhpB
MQRRARSLQWRIFAVNTAVFAAAVALLALTPAHVHARTRLSEVVTLVLGAVVLLTADLVLLRRTLAPLRRLVSVMAAVDPMTPSQRAPADHDGGEIGVLSTAFNEMLERLETERRESARRALAAQEDERLRVARELHDEVGQTLTAIAVRAEYAADRPQAQAQTLHEIAQATNRSLDDLRRIARELRPEALDDLGLANALIALCSRLTQLGGPQIRRDIAGELPALSGEAELVVYRVAQEALTNAIRHGAGADVDLVLEARPPGVALTIRDHGPGLPSDHRPGSGIRGMRERAMLVGAELEINSGRDQGVEVVLVLAAEQTAVADTA